MIEYLFIYCTIKKQIRQFFYIFLIKISHIFNFLHLGELTEGGRERGKFGGKGRNLDGRLLFLLLFLEN